MLGGVLWGMLQLMGDQGVRDPHLGVVRDSHIAASLYAAITAQPEALCRSPTLAQQFFSAEKHGLHAGPLASCFSNVCLGFIMFFVVCFSPTLLLLT